MSRYACIHTFEEVRIDIELVSGSKNDLRKSIDVRRKSSPLLFNEQRISIPRPVKSILIHPVALVSKEVRVEDVLGSVGPRLLDLSHPVEYDVKETLADTVDLLNCIAVLSDQLEVLVCLSTHVDRKHD